MKEQDHSKPLKSCVESDSDNVCSPEPDRVQVPAPSPRQPDVAEEQSKKKYKIVIAGLIAAFVITALYFPMSGDEFTKYMVIVEAKLAPLKINSNKKSKRMEITETPYAIYRRAGREAFSKRNASLAKEFFKKALIESEKRLGPVSYSRACFSQIKNQQIPLRRQSKIQQFLHRRLSSLQFCIGHEHSPVLAAC